MPKKLDLIGQVFGRLTVIEEAEPQIFPSGKKRYKWLCQCSCGNISKVATNHLRTGDIKSCGCYNIDNNTKHGKSHHYLFKTWQSIKDRCFNLNSGSYKNYGARGITIYEEWADSFQAFYDYIITNLGERPSKDYSLDRIDNENGNYEPDNLRWATDQVQSINQRIPKNNTSGVKGVSFHKQTNKWRAYIAVNRKCICLGFFDTKEEAIQARLEAEDKYYKPLLTI